MTYGQQVAAMVKDIYAHCSAHLICDAETGEVTLMAGDRYGGYAEINLTREQKADLVRQCHHRLATVASKLCDAMSEAGTAED